ncbi:transcription factor MEE8 [Eutrema salsugineum]|uniref:transcription factor MEE8 n=1 Tax=Eutrema salsugineum TaxID=72664 RepID=UPI000CED2D7D|nr:transcription factor MEE8 [Eutrema salsugineum]
MNNNEEFVQLWSEIMTSLATSKADSELRRTSRSEEDKENMGRKRPAESERERKRKRVKRQRVPKSSDKSHNNLLEKKKKRELIRSKFEELKQLTPNCPKSDILCILDSVIEYTKRLQLAVFLKVLKNYV